MPEEREKVKCKTELEFITEVADDCVANLKDKDREHLIRNPYALALSVSDNMDGKVYAVVKKELEELMKLSNEYFDVRHNDYLNAAKEKREALNDSQFIEYLYNRAYSLLYLLRLKSKKEENSDI